jgi:hypothetical protein
MAAKLAGSDMMQYSLATTGCLVYPLSVTAIAPLQHGAPASPTLDDAFQPGSGTPSQPACCKTTTIFGDLWFL